jgi:hypothetical protein
MRLSEFTIRKAKPKEKPYRLTDGGGLHLLVQSSGSKLWQMRYRHGGRENVLSFGQFPLVSLAEARRKRDEAKKLLIGHIDPAEQRRLDKIAAETTARQTFGEVASEYLEQQQAKKAAPATIVKTTWLLNDLASPLSDRPISKIAPAEILVLLRRIEKSGRRETARR